MRSLIDSILGKIGTFTGIYVSFGMKTAIAAVVIYGTAMLLVPEDAITDVFPAMEHLWQLAKVDPKLPANCW